MRFVVYTGEPSDPMRQRAYLVEAESEQGAWQKMPSAVCVQVFDETELPSEKSKDFWGDMHDDDLKLIEKRRLEIRLRNGVNVWDLFT